MLNVNKGLLAVSAAALFAVSAAQAAITVSYGGNAPPPSLVGGRIMTAYDTFDPQWPGFFSGLQVAQSYSNPAHTHTTNFNIAGGLSMRAIGQGWATWSQGYTGNVFYTPSTSLGLSLSPATKGYYLYIEPDPFALHNFTVTAMGADGSMHMASGTAHGQAGAALWTIDAVGTSIQSITINSDDGVGFAIGRFGYNLVPTPGALALLGLAGFAGRRRRA